MLIYTRLPRAFDEGILVLKRNNNITIHRRENDREMLMEGASRLQRGAMAAHEMARQVGASRARIQEGVDEDEEVSV
jgi:hypothetical protein